MSQKRKKLNIYILFEKKTLKKCYLLSIHMNNNKGVNMNNLKKLGVS